MNHKIIEMIRMYAKQNPKKVIVIMLYLTFLLYKKLTTYDRLRLFYNPNSDFTK